MPKGLRPDKDKVNTYLKYSSFALQFFFLVLIAAFIGQKLDAYIGLEKPLITAGMVVFFASAYMYKLIRDLSK